MQVNSVATFRTPHPCTDLEYKARRYKCDKCGKRRTEDNLTRVYDSRNGLLQVCRDDRLCEKKSP